MSKLGLIFLFCTFSIFAQHDGGGSKVGGGGNVVICPATATSPEKIELLDFFEARQTIKDFKLIDHSQLKGENIYEKAGSLIESLRTFSPYMTDDLLAILNQFKTTDITFIERGIITDIDDARTVISPNNSCYKYQIAVQVKNAGPYQYKLMIDKSVWEKLDEVTQIGLILHEVIYKVALDQGHTNSNKVRVLNAHLNGNRSMTTFDWEKVFSFSQIDGCQQMSLKVYPGEDVIEYVIPVKISTVIREKSIYQAEVCIDTEIYDFAGNHHGLLVLKKGAIIKVDDTFTDKQQISFESPNSRDIDYQMGAYLGTMLIERLPNRDGSYDVTYAADSTRYFHPPTNAVYLEKCLEIAYDSQGFTCKRVKGFFGFFNKDYTIKEVDFARFGNNRRVDVLWLDDQIRNVPIGDSVVSFTSQVYINEITEEDGKRDLILCFYYSGPAKKITINKQEFLIETRSMFYFREDGEFLKVEPPID